VSFERRHDHETGDSGAGSSQRRSRASQDQVEAVAPDLKMKFKMIHPMWFCHLTEMTTMMLDINQLTESMEVDRPI
jgi:hypothetical protein